MGIATEDLTANWRPARLIPTVGIRGQEEQERRATSSLLAVVQAVPEFGHALFGPLGAPKGRIQTFTEVQFKDFDGKTCIPDGAVVIERGRTVQHRFRGIPDPDQAWILGELIAYLDHEASGASGFTDMGPSWVSVRDGAHAGTLRAADPEARGVCERWEQFMEYLALGLSQDLGRDVSVVRPRKQAAEQRLQALVRNLADDGVLIGSIRVPDAVAPLDLRADLRTRRAIASVTVEAPGEGRPLSRINWLMRQVYDAPGNLRIEVAFQGTRETTSLLLADARENPNALLSPTDAKRVPRWLTLEAGRALGSKRGKGKGSFVADMRGQAIDFYRDIVQSISAWRAKPPRLPSEPVEPDPPASADPPPFAVAETREIGEAQEPPATPVAG